MSSKAYERAAQDFSTLGLAHLWEGEFEVAKARATQASGERVGRVADAAPGSDREQPRQRAQSRKQYARRRVLQKNLRPSFFRHAQYDKRHSVTRRPRSGKRLVSGASRML